MLLDGCVGGVESVRDVCISNDSTYLTLAVGDGNVRKDDRLVVIHVGLAR